MAKNSVPNFRLDGEVAVVTGGGSGIGRAAAIAFAEAGAKVAVIDVDGARATAVASELGDAALGLQADVSQEESIEAAIKRVADKWGQIDVLFNNAGLNRRVPSLDLKLEDWNLVMSVNSTGMFLTGRSVARIMKDKPGGRIVNTASVLGLSGGWYPNVAYQVSKGAVVNLTRSWAVEWAPLGIRVNAIAPGIVRTPFTSAITDRPEMVAQMEGITPMRRLGETSDMVGPILFLASPASSMVTGHILPVDGGILAQ